MLETCVEEVDGDIEDDDGSSSQIFNFLSAADVTSLLAPCINDDKV